LLVLSILTITLTTTFAQDFKDELDVIQSVWGKNKKAMTMDFLKLSAEDAAKFTPIYDGYLEERKKVAQVRAEALETFAAKDAVLDDATAQKMVSTLMKNNSNLAKLQSKTFKKLSKALSPAKAAQWWQLESYIDAEIRSAILGELPLLEPVKK
jgi:galactokinase